MELIFSHSTGLYQEKPNVFWLARRSKTTITRGSRKPESAQSILALKFTSGPAELYGYFPFLLHIYLNGCCREILEFTQAFEPHEVLLKLSADDTTLAVRCEQGSIPARKGIGLDWRELAIFMEWEVRKPSTDGLPPLNVSLTAKSDDFTIGTRLLDSCDLPRPIFVIGMYRTGTSILTWAIGRHPHIYPLEETGWLGPTTYGMLAGLDLAAQAKRSFLDVYDSNKDEMLSAFGASVDRLVKAVIDKNVRRTYLGRLSGLDSEFHPDFAVGRSLEFSYKRWVDGTPENTGYAYTLGKLFPLAQFIHIVRHPADVVASMMRFDRIGGDSMDLEQALDFWLRYTQWGLDLALACGSNVVKTVPYERLVQKPTIVLDEIYTFLGEPRFQQAASILRNRINSSAVAGDEREHTKRQLKSTSRYKKAQDLYKECVRLASLHQIIPDPESKAILEDQINDVETSLLSIFSGKPVTTNE